jgi:phospholipid/cholesterol/gamma-HCH transport system ATP-binding protein
VQGIGSMQELSAIDKPAIRQYFDGPRARAAHEQQASLPAKNET